MSLMISSKMETNVFRYFCELGKERCMRDKRICTLVGKGMEEQ